MLVSAKSAALAASVEAESLTPQLLEKDPQFAYTLAKGLEVLRTFDAASPTLGNREIAQRTGLSRPTVARLMRTLAMLGYVKYHEPTARYRLSVSVVALGYPMLAQLNVRQVARASMQELANFAHGAVSLAMRSGLQLVIVESCVDHTATTGRPDVGALRDLAETSLGHTYFSAADAAEQAEIAAALQARDPLGWPALKARLDIAQVQFKAFGFCITASPKRGIEAASVPLRAKYGGDTMVMNCAVASFLLQSDTLETQVGPRLLNLVRQVETSLGHG